MCINIVNWCQWDYQRMIRDRPFTSPQCIWVYCSKGVLTMTQLKRTVSWPVIVLYFNCFKLPFIDQKCLSP